MSASFPVARPRRLWRTPALRALVAGGASGVNPGANRVRVALVHDSETTGEALGRIVATLG